MKKTAILLSTSRQNGNTQSLVETINEQTVVDVYNLKNYNLSPFDYEHKNSDDDFVPLVQELLNYQHLVFATPVYWYSMSAQMKVFFDRISDLLRIKKDLGRQLKNKDCSIISTGSTPQPERSFEETFMNSFKYLAMNYQGILYCYCEEGFEQKLHKKEINDYVQHLLK